MGIFTGEVAKGVEPPVIFFFCSQNRRFRRFSPALPGRLKLREPGSLVPAAPGTVQRNDPKPSLLSREEAERGPQHHRFIKR